jgi:hypothetical protein
LVLAFAGSDGGWEVHDRNRPQPPVVIPGTCGIEDRGTAPSDAIILFDGKDLSQWQRRDGGPPAWKVENGEMVVSPKGGMLVTRRAFGDCQLHIEWATPDPPRGEDQDRGNSGVLFMGRYEIQILDSYRSITYPDGMAAAVYGQFPPLVNASRPPGQWQSYDIVFRRPQFDSEGKLTRPARVTVIHNGVLVQDNVDLLGPVGWKHRPPYKAHADRLPLMLQDHGHPVRFRNVWVRNLPETDNPKASALRLGVGTAVITPTLDTRLAGYNYPRMPDGVHDDLKPKPSFSTTGSHRL